MLEDPDTSPVDHDPCADAPRTTRRDGGPPAAVRGVQEQTTDRSPWEGDPATDERAVLLELTQSINVARVANDGTILPPAAGDDGAARADLERLPVLSVEGGGPAPHDLALGPTLGQGGSGVVRLAQQLPLQREVAVKALLERRSANGDTRELLQEAWITGGIEHPNVVPIYALGRGADGRPLMVMKRIEGVPLRTLVSQPDHPYAPADPEARLEWLVGLLIQVCNAIEYAHSKRVLHRDLKTDNVMVGPFGEVYVLDWGIAVSLAETPGPLPRAGDATNLAGTPAYMAPEMVLPGRTLDERTDVYLLGAMLHEIVTGRFRHRADTLYDTLAAALRSAPVDYDADVPAELADVCNRATHRDPDQRFPSAAAFRSALEEFLRHGGARRLIRDGAERLAALQTRLAATDPAAATDQDNIALQTRFTECRFAFSHALSSWPESREGRAHLDRALALMADYELGRGAADAAAVLLDAMATPDPALEARLEALRQRLLRDDRELERLRRLDRDADLAVSTDTRFIVALVVATAWLLCFSGVGLLERLGVVATGYWTCLALTAASAATLAFVHHRFGAALAQNLVNRRIFGAVLLTAFFIYVHWGVSFLADAPFRMALAETPLYGAVTTATVALSVDGRLVWATAAWICGTLAARMVPGWEFELVALAGFAGLGLSAFIWRPSANAEPVGLAR